LTFAAEWKGQKLTDADLQSLEMMLMLNPTAGASMGGGLRKIRFAAPSRHSGKSGAFRVCYAYFPAHSTITLVTMFAKNEKANLSKSEIKEISRYLRWYESTLSRKDTR
jgi:hypothetical protein